jgi:hypothetical protein
MKYLDAPIYFEDFDSEYYMNIYKDLRIANITTHNKAYNHWILYGSHEGRTVKKLENDDIMMFKLNIGERYKVVHKPKGQIVKITDTIDMCIMLYMYNINMLTYYNKFIETYENKFKNINIHVIVTVPLFENPFIKMNVSDYIHAAFINLKKSKVYINICTTEEECKGGDIGGLINTSKYAMELETKLGVEFKWSMFLHSKTKLSWRKELSNPLFLYNVRLLNDKCGIAGSKKWFLNFDRKKNSNYDLHILTLCKYFEIDETKFQQWKFIGGTMFILNRQIVSELSLHNDVQNVLNTHTSRDENWITLVHNRKLQRSECNNDYEYRHKFGKSLLSDFMIEHTFERFIGLICLKLNLEYGLIS